MSAPVNHAALIEQLHAWVRALDASFAIRGLHESERAVHDVITEMRRVAADLTAADAILSCASEPHALSDRQDLRDVPDVKGAAR
jgi:hypothetical protein